MTLTFRLRFHTHVGQSLFITGNHELLGDGPIETAIPLHYLDGESWQATVHFPDSSPSDTPIIYHYILRDVDGSTVQDWGDDRAFNPSSFRHDNVLIVDSWNPPGAIPPRSI